MSESEQSTTQTFDNFLPSVAEPSGADFGDTPLSWFRGRGAGFEVTGGTGRNNREWKRVTFRATDIEVKESSEPYPFPTAEISIFYNDPEKSPKKKAGQGTSDWEFLSESIRGIYGERAGTGIKDIFGGPVSGEGTMPENPGKVFEMRKFPTLLRVGPNQDAPEGSPADWRTKWHDETRMAWKIVEVEGVGRLGGQAEGGASGQGNGAAADILTHLVEVADGKQAAAFYEQALDDPEVMKSPGLIDQLNAREFLNTMVSLQRLTQDAQGVYHKV